VGGCPFPFGIICTGPYDGTAACNDELVDSFTNLVESLILCPLFYYPLTSTLTVTGLLCYIYSFWCGASLGVGYDVFLSGVYHLA
jgi:hypothetical protein